MKNFPRIKLLLIICFLAFGTQCSNDKATVKPKEVISSAVQLASDSSFISMVRTNRRVTSVLFEKMRSLGNNYARKQQMLNVNRLIHSASVQDNSKELAEQFGFRNSEEFGDFIFAPIKSKIELENRYSNYASIEKELKNNAYWLVVNNLIKKERGVSANRGNEVCPLCFFNNCSECSGDEQVETPAPGDGGGSTGSPCKNACFGARANSRNLAELEAGTELLACAPIFVSVQEYLIAREQYQNAPIGASLAALACASVVYARYINNINLAENNYVTCVYGCK